MLGHSLTLCMKGLKSFNAPRRSMNKNGYRNDKWVWTNKSNFEREKKKSEIRFLREWNKLIGIDELNQT